MNITLMGAGAFGTAMKSVLDANSHQVSIWQDGEVLGEGSTVVGAIPTQAIREVLEPSRGVKGITYINCAKGIERHTHDLPFQIVSKTLDDPSYFTLMGPSFAEEVVKKMPTLVNLGFKDNEEKAEEVKKLFQTDFFRVKVTRGVRSLELAAAFKNIYAIACGVTDGLGYEMNTRVKIMLLAMEEFNNLRKKLDYPIDEKAMPATVGDLILTCSSEESRNFTFGKHLAFHSPEKSLELTRGTVEGYYTVESIPYFEKETGVKLPLAHFVYEITHTSESKDIKELFTNFVKTT
ncbi:MAG: NAD(P)H-dependent glycerol-3-phosphate dehydrogenase [Candidatus Levyibacteriota bacterium]